VRIEEEQSAWKRKTRESRVLSAPFERESRAEGSNRGRGTGSAPFSPSSSSPSSSSPNQGGLEDHSNTSDSQDNPHIRHSKSKSVKKQVLSLDIGIFDRDFNQVAGILDSGELSDVFEIPDLDVVERSLHKIVSSLKTLFSSIKNSEKEVIPSGTEVSSSFLFSFPFFVADSLFNS